MRLGVEFSDGPDGRLLVIGLDACGSVAMAGGKIGDLWVTIDGLPAAEVLAQWHSGKRPHRPGVPLTVEIDRNGVLLVIRPAWRSDELTSLAVEDAEESDDEPTRPADETEPAPLPLGRGGLVILNKGSAVSSLRARLGKGPLHPNLTEHLAYRRRREISHSAVDASYDPFRDA
jgi:hypothetical protein